MNSMVSGKALALTLLTVFGFIATNCDVHPAHAQILKQTPEAEVSGRHLACRSEEQLLRLFQLIQDGDGAATKKYVDQKLTAKECVFFDKPTKVFVERINEVRLFVLFRPRGETDTYVSQTKHFRSLGGNKIFGMPACR